MKGKPWIVEEERKPAQLIKERKPLEVIAETLKESKKAIYGKYHRLELKLLEEVGEDPVKTASSSTSSLDVPKELPSVEETCF